MRHLSFLLFCFAQGLIPLIIVSACSQKAEIEIPEVDNLFIVSDMENGLQTIHLEKEAIFASSDDYLIARMGQFDIDDEGRFYIADTQQHRVHVFDSKGRHLTHFGREGAGPGEFRAIGALNYSQGYLTYMIL